MGDGTKIEQKKERLKASIAALAMELEIKEGRRFNIYNGAEEVSKVLKFSLLSDDENIFKCLRNVVLLLSEKQIAFFKTKGVDLDIALLDKRKAMQENKDKQEVLYRGKTQSDAPKEGDVPESQKGKRKIVYRGQVKWV